MTRTTYTTEAWTPPGFRERYARDVAEICARCANPAESERAIAAYHGALPAAWVEAVTGGRDPGAPVALASLSPMRKEHSMMKIEATARQAIADVTGLAPHKIDAAAARFGTATSEVTEDERATCRLWGVSPGVYAECKATVQLTPEEMQVALRHESITPEAMLATKALRAARHIDSAVRMTAIRRRKGA
jgi:hypothetical protein